MQRALESARPAELESRAPEAFRAWQQAAQLAARSGCTAPTLSAGQLRELLCFSLLAPTAHNTVPQKYWIDVSRQEVHFFLDESLVLEASDADASQALLSLGCAVESFVIGAEHHRRRVLWSDLNPGLEAPPGLRWLGVARALADPSVERADSLLPALCERRVIRSEYEPDVLLPPSLLGELTAAVQRLGKDLQLCCFDSPRQRFAWGKLDELAMKFKLEESEFRAELGRWLRDDDDADSPRGMRSREFGLARDVGATLRSQLLGDEALAVDQTAFMARMGKLAMASSSAVLAIAAGGSSWPVPEQLAVRAGRAYLRCALLTWRAGFANAIHTGVVQVPHARAMCQATLLAGALPLVVFRVGTPRDESHWSRPRASRPSIDDVLLAPTDCSLSRSELTR